MKDKTLKVRLSSKRLDKLRLSALIREKSMTQIVEEMMDNLPNPELKSPYKGEASDPLFR